MPRAGLVIGATTDAPVLDRRSCERHSAHAGQVSRRSRGTTVEFGIFNSVHVPQNFVDADPAGAEHARIMDEVEFTKCAD